MSAASVADIKPEAVPSSEAAATTSPAAAAAAAAVDAPSPLAGDDNAESANNLDPNATLLVRALVSTKEAGIIIGKGGANVAELREQTGVKAGVSKVVPGVHDRVLSVTGTLVGISDAFALIAKTILENPLNAPVHADGTPADAATHTTSVRLLISHNLMGTVIGRQGLKIKHIQDLSGARMVASKEMLPQSTERVVEVQGSVEAIRVAIHEIAKCLAEDWDRSQNVVLYQPGQGDGPGILAAGGMGGLQQQGSRRQGGPAYLAGAMNNMSLNSNSTTTINNNNNNGGASFNPNSTQQSRRSEGANSSRRTDPNAVVTPGGGLVAGATTNSANAGEPNASAPPLVDAANLRTQNISIPSDMVGCIIGKGGSKITEIRRLSGSRISIAKVPHDETGERMFTIQGTPEANEKALFLLYNQLETEKERRQKQTNNVGAADEDTPAAAATSSA
ncbi:related to poly(rC)-binding protein 3 [Melanopsichium pennsylvanicum]|uniref:Related to poly(RC)-binding protein 3 n=2 Tax=Melanopsichium pennsylvanicum TaxID=63383 RepID=A0AAJ5C618_9BASI|nr:related to poly(rC)-binding protein 3 [Melanopsichium pennsylvanicum 4]SNX85350.1 related to poly(rC)-binding protein 3 [Melanopsichium pennsylvanicum]